MSEALRTTSTTTTGIEAANGSAGIDFRNFMSHFPSGVTVVTAVDAGGRPHGFTCTSLTSVCLQPATLLVCVKDGSETLAAIRTTGRLAVNILNSRADRVAKIFSSPLGERFSQVEWELAGGGLPRLTADAAAFAECEVVANLEQGDHTILLCETRSVELIDRSALLYGQREYRQWQSLYEEETAS